MVSLLRAHLLFEKMIGSVGQFLTYLRTTIEKKSINEQPDLHLLKIAYFE
jgi:hypothetical protein